MAKALPSLMVFHGNLPFYRDRAVAQLLDKLSLERWRIEHLGREKGDTPEKLRSLLEGAYFLGGKFAVVLHTPKKDYQAVVAQHLEDPGDSVVIVKYDKKLRDKSAWEKLAKSLGEKNFYGYTKASASSQKNTAKKSLVAQAKKHNKKITADVVDALLYKYGTDLAHLHGELQKAILFSDHLNSDEITIQHVKQILAPFVERNIFDAATALEHRNARKLARVLLDIRASHKGSIAIRVARALAAPVSRWMLVENTRLRGISPAEASGKLGMTTWIYEQNLRVCVRWRWCGLVDLLSVLAATERSVLSGGLDPWSVLFCGLIQACQRKVRP